MSVPVWVKVLKNRRASRRRVPFRLIANFEQLEPRQLLAFDPSPLEQAFMEDVNRMRQDPQGELSVLFSNLNPLVARDADVQAAINYFRVDSQTLQSQWADLVPSHPLAWNEDLYDAAVKHNLQMQAEDEQGHQVGDELSLGPRVTAEGYQFRKVNENVYAFAESHIHGHAGFVVDWGEGPGGIQSPAGHRVAMMDQDVIEVGIAVLRDTSPVTQVGPYLVTQDFGQPRVTGDAFLLGVSWDDTNGNGIYDPGEGLGGASIQVTGTGGTFTTTSMSAGGYQVRVPDGTYQVTATGGSFGNARVISGVVVAGHNVKVDFQPSTGTAAILANPDSLAVSEDATASINVLANDRYSNGASVIGTVEITSDPTNGSILQNVNGTITYRPQPDFNGSDTFRYRVRANSSLVSNEATVTVMVNGINDSPLANSFEASTPEDNPLSIPLPGHVTDRDNAIDWSQLRITTPPVRGSASVDVASRSIVYTPAANFNGAVSLQYQVADVAGAVSNVATISINVSAVNDLPVAVNDVFATMAGNSRTLAVKQNDSDSDGDLGAAVIVIDSSPSHGEVSLTGGSLLYVPRPGFTGQDIIEYSLRDPVGGRSATARVSVLVTSPATPWRNPANPLDVSGDEVVALQDAVLIINQIGKPLIPNNSSPPPLYDVTGDNAVAARDAVQVINYLALNMGGGQASASLTVVAPGDEQQDAHAAAVPLSSDVPQHQEDHGARSDRVLSPLAPFLFSSTVFARDSTAVSRAVIERSRERLVDQIFAQSHSERFDLDAPFVPAVC